MARGKRISLEDKLIKIDDEILNMEHSLKELKETRKEIEEQIRMNRLIELEELISEKGMNFDEVKELINNKE